jgi:hypothetical protein
VVLGVSSRSFDTLGQFHVDVRFNRSLRVRHNEINLPKSSTENDAKNYHEPDGKPGDNRRMCFEVVHPIHLFSTMKTQPGFVFDNFVCGEVMLVPHCSDRRYNLCLFWNILPLD